MKHPPPILLKKQQLRTVLKHKRNAIAKNTRIQASDKICCKLLSHPRVQSAKTIFTYLSFSSEVITTALIIQLLQQNKTVAVPKIVNRNTMIAVKFNGWDDLIEAELGIMTPQSATPLNTQYDLVLTPGLGFSPEGHRIGFGAGYYDRWFSKNAFDYSIALAFDEQLIDEIPVDTFDQTVNEIITPEHHYIVDKKPLLAQ